MLIHEFSSIFFFHESSLQVLSSCFRTGKIVVDFHFWICLETSEVFKEDELSVCKERKGF